MNERLFTPRDLEIISPIAYPDIITNNSGKMVNAGFPTSDRPNIDDNFMSLKTQYCCALIFLMVKTPLYSG